MADALLWCSVVQLQKLKLWKLFIDSSLEHIPVIEGVSAQW